MCLETVDKKPTSKHGVGYKLVLKDESGYLSFDFVDRRGTRYPPVGQWGEDPNLPVIVTASDGHSYTSGFHVALDANEVGRYASDQKLIIKVEFRKVVATCSQDYFYGRQVVARKLKVIGEVERVAHQ